jgi:DNA modification methylase
VKRGGGSGNGAFFSYAGRADPALKITAKREKISTMNLPPNQILHGSAAQVLADLPASSIACVITSPPYWQSSDGSSHAYKAYLDGLQAVWLQCARVLRPNGKLCINAPIMPIPKAVIEQHTRHPKNIAFDIEHRILAETDLERYSLFVWQKQTSKMMFGSRPYPGNPIENNTIEFINVFVKLGKPLKFPPHVKAANKIGDAEWRDYIQQVWFMYPADVARVGHPNPFPPKLPGRLIRMYTMGAADGFDGEIVLDPFCGSGTTCTVAKQLGRRFIGIEINERHAEIARRNVFDARVGDIPVLLVGRAKYMGKDELIKLTEEQAGNSGKDAEAQHKAQRYGTRRTDEGIGDAI